MFAVSELDTKLSDNRLMGLYETSRKALKEDTLIKRSRHDKYPFV